MTITQEQAHTIARETMDNWGLGQWRYTLDNAVRRNGACFHGQKRISMSRKVLEAMTMEQFMNTLHHEIAHALVGPGHGHDAVWRDMHYTLGGNGRRCSQVDTSHIVPKWLGTCPNGHTISRHRLTKRAKNGSCPKCSPVFNEAYKFEWTELIPA